MSLVLAAVVGGMLSNHRRNDPEWRFQAGYLADYLEAGGPLPDGRALGGICRIAGRPIMSRQEIIEWARAQERILN